MTRINVIPVQELTDQHLMAEYRELPMVMASARRSDPAKHVIRTAYTLNKGHVSFFYDKRKFLLDRWLDLIAELYDRGFNIDPASRKVRWRELDRFPQSDWKPDWAAMAINRQRIVQRIEAKRSWYRYRGKPL